MTTRLVPRPRAAIGLLVASVVVFAALGLIVNDHTGGNRFDDAAERWTVRAVPNPMLHAMLHFTDPPLVVGLVLSVAIVAAMTRRWDVSVLAALAPAAATVLTEAVLKPLVHRTGLAAIDGLTYPSGHETGVASLLAVLAVLVLGSSARRGHKIAAIIAFVIVGTAAAVALVGLHYHFATDTIGAMGVAVGTTLAVALGLDLRLKARPRAPV